MDIGRIIQINVKNKIEGERGIPKTRVERAIVRTFGLEGDYNIHRQELGGDNDMAVLIVTTDRIRELRERGWDVQFGHLGENFTIDKVNYDFFGLGKRYGLGKEVIVEISRGGTPCRNLSVLPYVGEERLKNFQQGLLGRRGWYARVIQEGNVFTGDEVRRL
jgi:MOSC domain-containing protein YiiM